MSAVLAPVARLPRLNRFVWLMALYAENHRKLSRLFAPAALAVGDYRSQAGDSLPLRLEVIEQHRFTTELRLTYDLLDPLTGQPDPSAHLRHYHDARQTEATHCYVGRRWQDVIGMYPPPAALVDHRLRMNTFLGKWLDYLAGQGHGVATLRRVAPRKVESVDGAPLAL
ncbi:DUF1249 domain-containing protein [Luteimonas sp. e5]